MGTTVLYMGDYGAGQLTKMINNCALNICAASFCELMPLGVKLGLDPEKLGEVLMTASGSSYASRLLIPEILKGSFSHGFSLERAYKDMTSMLAVTGTYAVPLPALSGTMQTYQLALRKGYGGDYKGAMIRFYEELLGVDLPQHKSKPPVLLIQGRWFSVYPILRRICSGLSGKLIADSAAISLAL